MLLHSFIIFTFYASIHDYSRVLIAKNLHSNWFLTKKWQQDQQWRWQLFLMKCRHPEISFIIPSMTCSQGGKSPILLLWCKFSVVFLRHEFSIVFFNATLPVIFFLSKHSVLLLREESSVIWWIAACTLPSEIEKYLNNKLYIVLGLIGGSQKNINAGSYERTTHKKNTTPMKMLTPGS